MARIRVLLVLSIVLAYFSYPLDRHALAEEYEEDLGVSQLKNKAKVINLSDVSKIDLSKINKIALSITSTSPLFGDVAEDQFSVKLRNKGFKLVELSKISDLTLREARKKELERLKEQLEIEKQLDQVGEQSKEQKRLELLEKQLEEAANELRKEVRDTVDVAKELGLDAVLIGTLLEGKRQASFPNDNPPRIVDKIIVTTFHIKVVDAKTSSVVLTILLEYDKGEDVSNAVDTMVDFLESETKGKKR